MLPGQVSMDGVGLAATWGSGAVGDKVPLNLEQLQQSHTNRSPLNSTQCPDELLLNTSQC